MPTRKMVKDQSPSATKMLADSVLKQGMVKREKSPKSFTSIVLNSRKGKDSIFDLVHLGLWDQTVQLRKGLSVEYVSEVSDALDMTRASFLDSLQLPRSTIEARIKKKTPLTSAEGGAVLRTAKALAKAEEVFEDHEAAAKWFKREIRSLGGVTPVSLMDTESGFELVMKTLGRIEYGVVA